RYTPSHFSRLFGELATWSLAIRIVGVWFCGSGSFDSARDKSDDRMKLGGAVLNRHGVCDRVRCVRVEMFWGWDGRVLTDSRSLEGDGGKLLFLDANACDLNGTSVG